MTSAARPLERDGDDRGGLIPRAAPVEPSWIELARQAFARRWHEENADDFEDSTEVYGE